MSNEQTIRLLIVEDEHNIRRLCMTIGASLGFACTDAQNAERALEAIEAEAPDLVLTDLILPKMSGVELLREIKARLPRAEVAIMTGHGTIESAVQAMRLGAYDYVTKPFRVEELKLVLERMAEKVRLVEENQVLREHVSTEMQLNAMVGSSAKIQEVLRLIARLKDARAPVLITGESGTGKELVARAIHFRGSYAKRPFVAVDCGALVPTLIESELFGYEKGAFTGAIRASKGLFQAADGGTIFLDEIGELPLEMQAKLLRVLQEKEVRRVGSNERVKLDVRVIAASNRDLEAQYRAGAFRKDLYFRLNVVTVQLPSLRDRKSDIPALVEWFLDKYGRVARPRGPQRGPNLPALGVEASAAGDDHARVAQPRGPHLGGAFATDGVEVSSAVLLKAKAKDAMNNTGGATGAANVRISPAAMKLLLQYDWPGNVRELENAIERAVTLRNSDLLQPHDLPPAVRGEGLPKVLQDMAADAVRLPETRNSKLETAFPETRNSKPETAFPETRLDDLERMTIQRVFEQVNGDKVLAQKMLGISRATLYRKLKRYNLLGKGVGAS